ncbi:hypothetical protein MNEG_14240, partial [Monoraphidium neglectum]
VGGPGGLCGVPGRRRRDPARGLAVQARAAAGAELPPGQHGVPGQQRVRQLQEGPAG